MIVTSVQDFPKFSATEALIVDAETTSWDDDEKALYPYKGHRACGYALGTLDGKSTWYLPIRHHSGIDDEGNLPLIPVQRYLNDLFSNSSRPYINHNLKFDLHFMHQDKIEVKGELQDTMVLARLVEHERYSYSLDALGRDRLKVKKLDLVKKYCQSIKTKDFGRTPIRLMGEYAEQDARMTADLFRNLIADLSEKSIDLWRNECELLKWLYISERSGIPIDVELIKQTYKKALSECIPLLEEIKQIAGWEVNPQSPKDMSILLTEQLGFEPRLWNYDKKNGERKGPSWPAMILEQLPHPVGKKLARASHLCHFISTYLEGWLKRLGDDGRLHASFSPAGTRTGRLSSRDPNFQNVPVEAEPFVLPFPGDILVYFDYSQVEYRIFAHYTQAPNVMKAYQESKDADFHQALADMLGVDRAFAKQLNFSFLYGMGRKTLINQLAAVLATKGTEDMAHKMRSLLGSGFAQKAGLLNTAEQFAVAEKLYRQYHKMFPEIGKLARRIKRLLSCRGYIRNYYGRIYRGISAHKGPNYVIQGTAADLFKYKLNDVFKKVAAKLGGKMLTIIHDSHLWSVPKEVGFEFFNACKTEMERVGLRVPIIADGKVGLQNWGSLSKLKGDPSEIEYTQALEESLTLTQRDWGG